MKQPRGMDGYTSEFGLYVRQWLEEHGNHTSRCAARDGDQCNCGYAQMVRGIEQDRITYAERSTGEL